MPIISLSGIGDTISDNFGDFFIPVLNTTPNRLIDSVKSAVDHVAPDPVPPVTNAPGVGQKILFFGGLAAVGFFLWKAVTK